MAAKVRAKKARKAAKKIVAKAKMKKLRGGINDVSQSTQLKPTTTAPKSGT